MEFMTLAAPAVQNADRAASVTRGAEPFPRTLTWKYRNPYL